MKLGTRFIIDMCLILWSFKMYIADWNLKLFSSDIKNKYFKYNCTLFKAVQMELKISFVYKEALMNKI